MKIKSNTTRKHSFADIPDARVQRSVFDLSCQHKTTFDAGKLIPVYCEEVLPGDTFSCQGTLLARLATPIYPIMDNMWMDIHFFFCANRLVWEHWEEMMGQKVNPGDTTVYQTPIVTVNTGSGVGFAALSLYDYLGIPTEVDDITVMNLPARMYNLIYNEWYRDANLQDSIHVDTDDGPDDISDYIVRTRGKVQDYFTTALTAPQKGTAVTIPLGSTAPVVGIGVKSKAFPISNATAYETGGTGSVNYPFAKEIDNAALDTDVYIKGGAAADSFPQIYADLSNATAPTVNELREAFATQQLLETDARGGTRYTEMIRAHFGVTSPDARLQRPEYLGGSRTPVIITPIIQQSSTSGSAILGDLGAMGVATMYNGGFPTKSFTEHGWILGIVSVRADLTYSQGIPRKFSRRDRYDYYMPVLAHLGEQAILKQEIYATEDAAVNAQTFGYQERWSEYRQAQNRISGLFRPNHPQTLAAWHLSQEFGSMPTLNSTFITENAPMARVIAVTTEPHFIFDSDFKVRAVRTMPMFSVPGLERL